MPHIVDSLKSQLEKRCKGLYAPMHITDFFVRFIIVQRDDL